MSARYFRANGDIDGDTNVLGTDLNLLREGATVGSLGKGGAARGDRGIGVKRCGDVVARVHSGLTNDDKVGARGTTVDNDGVGGGHGHQR